MGNETDAEVEVAEDEDAPVAELARAQEPANPRSANPRSAAFAEHNAKRNTALSERNAEHRPNRARRPLSTGLESCLKLSKNEP